jgi:hypothetical protein
MTIRRIFLALVAPLFLLLAGVNSALLYAWELAEAEDGLERQAIAAAVTTAAFADAHDDLAAALADPVRDAGLREAARAVPGLVSLHVLGREGDLKAVYGAPLPQAGLSRPAKAVALPVRTDAEGRRLVTGLAPLSDDRFVAAQIDAEPLFDEMNELWRLITGLVIGAGLLGLALALAIARGLTRELDRAGAMIEAIRTDAPAGEPEGFRIRETRDLALAVRLMRTSVAGRLARGRRELARRDRERDEAAAARAQHDVAFPALSVCAAGAALAVRPLGLVSPGMFYALCVEGERAGLALGECAGETPAAALAQALAAQRFLAARLLEGDSAEWIAEAQAAFGATRVDWRVWSTAAPATGVLSLLDANNAARAAAYGERAVGLTPDAVVADLAALLDADGLVAAVGSPDGGDRRVQVRGDDE